MNVISASCRTAPPPLRIWAGNYDLVDGVKINPETAEISDKLKALLNIAGKVQKGGKQVTSEDVARARRYNATHKEIHDTVLIAAAFCMYNRYVDGLGTFQPKAPEAYREMGERMAHEGIQSGNFQGTQCTRRGFYCVRLIRFQRQTAR